MDKVTATHIAITNLLTKGIGLHNSIAAKTDALAIAYGAKEAIPTLPDIGPQFKDIVETYKELRNLTIVFEYLTGHDIFTLCNDFKMSKAAILKILKDNQIELRKEK